MNVNETIFCFNLNELNMNSNVTKCNICLI